MNEVLGIGIPAYILIGLIMMKWVISGSQFERELESESSGILLGRWSAYLVAFLAGVWFWPVVLTVAVLAVRKRREH